MVETASAPRASTRPCQHRMTEIQRGTNRWVRSVAARTDALSPRRPSCPKTQTNSRSARRGHFDCHQPVASPRSGGRRRCRRSSSPYAQGKHRSARGCHAPERKPGSRPGPHLDQNVLVPWIFDYYTKLGFSPAHKINKIHALRAIAFVFGSSATSVRPPVARMPIAASQYLMEESTQTWFGHPSVRHLAVLF